MIEIRKATLKDIPAMAQLWKSLVLDENPDFVVDMQDWSESQKRLMDLDNYHIYVAVDGDKVVGFNNGMALTDYESGSKYVEGGHFYVSKEYRKSIAGFRLHRNSIDQCKKLNAKFLRRHVSVNNKRMVERFMKSKNHYLKEYVIDEVLS